MVIKIWNFHYAKLFQKLNLCQRSYSPITNETFLVFNADFLLLEFQSQTKSKQVGLFNIIITEISIAHQSTWNLGFHLKFNSSILLFSFSYFFGIRIYLSHEFQLGIRNIIHLKWSINNNSKAEEVDEKKNDFTIEFVTIQYFEHFDKMRQYFLIVFFRKMWSKHLIWFRWKQYNSHRFSNS